MAVKKLRETASYSTQKVKLLQEAAIMGQFHHTNVVKLYGMMTIGEPVSIGHLVSGSLSYEVRHFAHEGGETFKMNSFTGYIGEQ